MDSQNIYGIKESSSLSKTTSDFIKSNDMISNFMFIIILLIFSIVIFNICVKYFLYILTPSNSPHLIDGMVDAKDSEMKISQDPDKSSSKTIIVSNNEDTGLEFTWSFWLYIDDLDYRRGEIKNVFVKGDNVYANSNNEENDVTYDEINNTMNSPGVYLTPFDNKLMFVFNTYDKVIEKFEIDNIPLNKWLNIIIRCENKTIDVFINGSFSTRFKLSSLPKQNYNNVYIGKDGGFAGYVSNLWYYNYALGTREINNIYKKGANTKLLNDKAKDASGATTSYTDSFRKNYLSFRWFI